MFNSRRSILAGAAALAAAPIAQAVAQAQPQASRDPAAMPMPDVSGVRTAKQFAMAEKQGQHLATLALATFKEHVAITKRISGELQA